MAVASLIAMAPSGSVCAKQVERDPAVSDQAPDVDPTTAADLIPADPADPTPPIEEVLVSGEHPGPGLWKVTHGTHVLWIFGAINPAPKNMTWHSAQVESIVASSKQVLAGENISPNIGFFKGLTLLPSVLRLRFNPDKAALKDMIPPDVYERWLPLRKRYFKDDEDIEKVRPMFIAMMLYQKAIERAGLTRSDELYSPIFNTAKKNHVPVKQIEVKFDVDDPRQKIRDYAATPRDVDVGCLVAAIDRLDDDVTTMQKRATAWATGDIQALAALPVPVQEAVCQDAVMSAPGLQDELGTLKNRLLATWLSTTSSALATNDVTFMILPVATLLKPDGRLAVLRERGYGVEAPAN
jgi:uncharacterized protein YbaP (TraB family)